MSCMNKIKKLQLRKKKGITLIALVITIIVLLVLVGVSIAMLTGENGIIVKAQEASFKSKIAKVDEQFKLYINQKKLENRKFEKGTLNIGETSLFYNTKEENEQGNIYTVLEEIDKEFVKEFEVIKGEMYYFTQNERELQWALEVGMKTNPYEIVDGVLISSDKNLSLMDESTGTITIPERVKIVGEGTFAKLEGMKKIIIPATCKAIKENAFNGNPTLEEVLILAEGNKGLEKIGGTAFENCTSLQTISMPDTVKQLGYAVFRNCQNLVNVKLSSNIQIINSHTFAGCSKLREITIPEGIREIKGFVFQDCTILSKVSLPESLEQMENECFFGVSSLEAINLANGNQHFLYENGILLTKDRTKMFAIVKQAINGNTFVVPTGIEYISNGVLVGFGQISKVIIPSTVTQIEAGFFPWTLEEIEINKDNPNYTSVNQQLLSKDKKILYFCYSKAQTITLEEGIETIKGSALGNCYYVTTVNFPSTLKKLESMSLTGMNSVRNIKLGKNLEEIDSWTFAYNSGLENVEIDLENPHFMSENGVIYTKDKTKLVLFVNNAATKLEIPEGIKIIGDSAFVSRYQLAEVILPTSLKTIEANAFYECRNLAKIEIPNNVEEISWSAFVGCSNLKEIIIDKQPGSIKDSPWSCVYGDRAVKWLR